MSRFDIPSTERLRAREKVVLDHFQDEVVALERTHRADLD